MSVNTVTISLEDYKNLTKRKKKIQKELQDRENRVIERELIVEAKQDELHRQKLLESISKSCKEDTSYYKYKKLEKDYETDVQNLKNEIKNTKGLFFFFGMVFIGLIWIVKEIFTY